MVFLGYSWILIIWRFPVLLLLQHSHGSFSFSSVSFKFLVFEHINSLPFDLFCYPHLIYSLIHFLSIVIHAWSIMLTIPFLFSYPYLSYSVIHPCFFSHLHLTYSVIHVWSILLFISSVVILTLFSTLFSICLISFNCLKFW